MKTYIWAVDAGHEWLAVKKKELIELGIADKISYFSYEKGGTAYLEGDCDAETFFIAYKQKHGVEPKTKQGKVWDVQPLRRFASYKKPNITQEEVAVFQEPGNTLADYVNKMNDWNAIFGTAAVEFPLTAEGAQKIADKLDSELSPENLHCDGEISHAEAMRKYNFLSLVADELNIYCDANGLTRPTIYEL
jgi:hypothetical protein